MRPYRRKHHLGWRTRRPKKMIEEVRDYLKPFVHCTKSVWQLEPPFPLTAKLSITALMWFLLFLPLCYFLVPPVALFILINYFSEIVNVDGILTQLAETCARSAWPKKAITAFKFINKVTLVFFLYDYYQILKCLRTERT